MADNNFDHLSMGDTGLPFMRYCSIDLASKLLNVPVEVIEHWIEIGVIRACVKYDDYIISEDGDEIIKYTNEFSKYSYAMFTDDSRERIRVSGLWQIMHLWEVETILNEGACDLGNEISDKGVMIIPTLDIRINREKFHKFPYLFKRFPTYQQDLLIVQEDLITAHRLSKGQLTPENVEEIDREQSNKAEHSAERAPRVDALPSHAFMEMVAAAKISTELSAQELSNKIDAHLTRSGRKALNIQPRTLSNWKNKAEERSER